MKKRKSKSLLIRRNGEKTILSKDKVSPSKEQKEKEDNEAKSEEINKIKTFKKDTSSRQSKL
jgi:hypothetical protein